MLAALFLLVSIATSATTLYVTPTGSGQGNSWATAFGDLQAALKAAKAGDEIWVAQGTYLPSRHNRSASFHIPNQVRVYGGFNGTETLVSQRNSELYLTVLSGDLGAEGKEGNVYSVVTFKQASAATVLDGFVISGGYANGDKPTGHPARCGGGLFNDGSNGSSTPTIANCVFTNNNARDGGAVYNLGLAGKSSPTFTNCIFKNNSADIDGGAVYNDGRQGGSSSPVFDNCRFEDNMASYGAAIFIGEGNNDCNFEVRKCVFQRNAAYLWGGGIYSLTAGNCNLKLSYCKFVDNYPTNINKRRSHTQDIEGMAVLLTNK